MRVISFPSLIISLTTFASHKRLLLPIRFWKISASKFVRLLLGLVKSMDNGILWSEMIWRNGFPKRESTLVRPFYGRSEDPRAASTLNDLFRLGVNNGGR